MFKKTLVALAALGAFAGSAAAADVTLYGVADAGLLYTHNSETTFAGDKTNTDEFGMASGMNATSRFGLKGTEDLGNGLKVSFKLENGYNIDDGTLGNGGRLFGREASVTLAGGFGQVSFGRMGGVASSAGTYDLVYVIADTFDGGDNNILGINISDRYDNMVTYQTPEFAGLQATFQYSFKTDTNDAGTEGSSKAQRYASAALTGNYGPAQLVAAYEMTKQPNNMNADETHAVYLGGNYDLGVAKLFAMAQYTKGSRSFGSTGYELDDHLDANDDGYTLQNKDGIDSWGLHLGTIIPVAGGDLSVGAYYLDGDVNGVNYFQVDNNQLLDNTKGIYNADLRYYGLSARYAYPLSKRTTVYLGAGYGEVKADVDEVAETNPATGTMKDEVTQVYMGLTHTF